ncbi:TetR/AcrR family transcriptional regulator [Paenibacillus larvae]|uniref:Fatty acid metabolism regulator protein FadR n=4 Tax=Paenibacillus larvae TaxID=1464 RepID=V9W611_9BACL|nr:TetR/AcrR family transcriptional regulator [Paenibacillus larvae]AHD05364.1 fatty acid metabolism regulator protein FadR [Paenibacillus larvae subsp. larvae DSM 25430]AQR77128.1 TetR family transcriptional regulator [Paenibacillus larvae subsp. larvae]AQT86489.1 TetR family transcriptional regulator [Paenibacillus larvae subsp. pulvifaciens]AQZ48143.1 TetR family transcriptional regulator [Paenibacillus larvae subsp. pulvifaciens]ARF66779.1 TetR family transcriptional regulator [Paenibacill
MTSKKREKYQLILDAALKVFAEHGFHRSQVSKIAKAAGVADGTIYLYFKRKEDILISLFREKLGELVSKFNQSIETSTDMKQALYHICRIHYTELEQDVDLAFVTQIELRQSSLELRREIGKAVKPYIVLIEQLLLKGIEEEVFRPDLDVKLTRSLIFGAMDEVVTSWLVSGRKYSLSDQVEGTVQFFLRGIEKSAS